MYRFYSFLTLDIDNYTEVLHPSKEFEDEFFDEDIFKKLINKI